MSLINSTYSIFTSGNFNLFLQRMDTDVTSILDNTCQSVEDNILSKLFGDVMYLDFKNNLSEARYLELINGYKVGDVFTAYGIDGQKRVYYGLKDMLAYFTYFYYVQNQYNFNPTVQEKTDKVEKINPVNNTMRAYNLGQKLYYDAKYFIEWKQLNDSTLFPDFIFNGIAPINSFNI